LALPVWILTSAIGVSPLLNLIASYVILALIPVGLLIAAGRGLWGKPESTRLFSATATTLIIAVALAAAAVAGLWWRANQPQVVDVAALVPADGPVPMLLDTDMAMDDIPALFYLLQHPGADLRAITVNGVAFVHCDPGVRHMLGLLEVARAPQIPVACGREESYPGGTPAPDDWRASADKLHGGQVRTGDREPDSRPAAELLADTIQSAPGETVVVALGPLTNLAEAFQADPALAGQIKQIVIMGGAVNVPGNVADGDSANEVAEWNFFADPVAADIVLASGAPVALVPLDATNDVPLTRGFYQRLRTNARTRPAVFTYNLLYMNQWRLDGGTYWWDALAAAATLDGDVVEWREMNLDVVTEAGPEMGRAIESAGGSPARAAVAADRQRFEALFLAVLNDE
jgi:pyrimidine-specific ribonucleoside hydrolase